MTLHWEDSLLLPCPSQHFFSRAWNKQPWYQNRARSLKIESNQIKSNRQTTTVYNTHLAFLLVRFLVVRFALWPSWEDFCTCYWHLSSFASAPIPCWSSKQQNLLMLVLRSWYWCCCCRCCCYYCCLVVSDRPDSDSLVTPFRRCSHSSYLSYCRRHHASHRLRSCSPLFACFSLGN